MPFANTLFISQALKRGNELGFGRISKVPFLGLGIATIWIILDQITKTLAQSNLSHGPDLLFGQLGFELIYNSGIAFGIAPGSSWLITIFDLLVASGLVFALFRTKRTPIAIGIGLVLGGSLGNVMDRLFRHNGGAVIDFLHSGFWPTFNLADLGVVVGLVIIVFYSSRTDQSAKAQKTRTR